jgi:cytoskeleton protein RodZ
MLGAPVFAKGHLRKYAALVGVDPDDVLQDYYRLTRAQGMPPVVGKVRKQAREISPGPWIALIVALLIAAIAYWWFVARDASLPTTGLQPVSNTQASDPGSVDVESAATILGVEASLPPSPEPQSAVPQSSTPEAATPVEATGPAADNTVLPGIEDANATAPLAVAAGELRLSLSFSGECWTEVTDANGRRLFFDLGRAGRNVNVSGEAPLSVLFGNAENVSVQVNGSDYEIQAADRRGQTARFSVSSP